MGFMDELKKLTRPYDEDADDFIDEVEEAEDPPSAPPAQERQRQQRTNPFSNFSAESASFGQSSFGSARESASRTREGRVVNLSGGAGNAQMQVVLIKPERFETAAEIADHLRGRRTVLMNLEEAPKDITRRLVDFLSGVTYAIDGNIRKVASNTYILTPPGVNLVGNQMDELEASSIYF